MPSRFSGFFLRYRTTADAIFCRLVQTIVTRSTAIIITFCQSNINLKINIMSKEEKIEKIYKAIDALIDLCEIEEINAHYLVHSEESIVSKLRSKIHEIED